MVLRATATKLVLEPSTPADPLEEVRDCLQLAFYRGRKADGIRLTPSEDKRLAELERRNRGDERGKRLQARFGVFVPAILETHDGLFRGMALNFSAGGIFIATDANTEIGALIHVRLGAPSGERYLFSGFVRHLSTHKNLRGLGIEFPR